MRAVVLLVCLGFVCVARAPSDLHAYELTGETHQACESESECDSGDDLLLPESPAHLVYSATLGRATGGGLRDMASRPELRPPR